MNYRVYDKYIIGNTDGSNLKSFVVSVSTLPEAIELGVFYAKKNNKTYFIEESGKKDVLFAMVEATTGDRFYLRELVQKA
jgi:hypothetical protein